jgi:elongation factor G
VIPGEFIPGVDKGIREQMKSGPLAGYPVMDLGVRRTSVPTTMSTLPNWRSRSLLLMAFRLAHEGQPGTARPIMKVEVETPEDYMGDVIGDLNRRRGLIEGMEDGPSGKIVRALVPLAEMFGYATSLRSATQGRASTPWNSPSITMPRPTSPRP